MQRIGVLADKKGSGYILDAASDSVRLYRYINNYCDKEKNDYIEQLPNSVATFKRKDDTLSIVMSDFGPAESE